MCLSLPLKAAAARILSASPQIPPPRAPGGNDHDNEQEQHDCPCSVIESFYSAHCPSPSRTAYRTSCDGGVKNRPHDPAADHCHHGAGSVEKLLDRQTPERHRKRRSRKHNRIRVAISACIPEILTPINCQLDTLIISLHRLPDI